MFAVILLGLSVKPLVTMHSVATDKQTNGQTDR